MLLGSSTVNVFSLFRNNCTRRVVVFVDEENGDVDNIPSDGEGLDGNDETSDESDADSDVSKTI